MRFPSQMALSLLVVMFAGCGTTPGGRRWGDNVTLLPGWTRLKDAAVSAAIEPATWAPLAGALALQVGNADEDISEWARENNPVFQSEQTAHDAADTLNEIAIWSMWSTALLAPSGNEPLTWTGDKAKGMGVEYLAVLASKASTTSLKDMASRTRPDRSNHGSFPSGHASSAATHSTLAMRNIDTMNISDRSRTIAHGGLYTLEAGTAWGSVEAARHYPSDVLAGLALGHFVAEFFDKAFLGLEDPDRPHVLVFTTGLGDAFVGLSCTFE